MSSPAVAIVVPCHAREPFQLTHLDETLATVDAQTRDDYEVVVVDDGSTQAFERGLRRLIPIFVNCVVENLEDRVRVGDCAGALRSARVLAREDRARSQALVDAGHDGAPLLASVLSGPA